VEEEVGGGEDNGTKNKPPAIFITALQAIHTVRKYLIKFDVDSMIVAVLSVVTRTRCMYRFQHKAKKQQL
jgi:hypothetical protein